MTDTTDKIKISKAEMPNTLVFGFEGVNGSGKSHVLSMVGESLESEGSFVITNKIAGLGSSGRVQTLKDILKYREEERLAGRQTSKHQKDHKRQILFRLATRKQIKEYYEILEQNKPDIALLDRTPLMTLVYVLADDPSNPYLEEIKTEAFELTRNLGINRIFLFDVDHLTSITRTLARTVIRRSNPDKFISYACEVMDIPGILHEELRTRIFRFIQENPDLMPKDFSPWDLNPYSLIANESINYRRVLEEARQAIGVEFSIINSDIDLNSITQDILGVIDQYKSIDII